MLLAIGALFRLLIGQAVDVPSDVTSDPLVDIEGEDIIYVGLVLLIATILIAIGAYNHKLGNAVFFALFLSTLFMVLIFLA